MKIVNFISKVAGRHGLLLKKHSPTILLVGGIVGVVASAVLACRATLKVSELLEDHKEKTNTIEAGRKVLSKEVYTDKDYKEDMIVQHVQTAVAVIKLYGPAIVLGAISIASIVGAHTILNKRNLALVAAYKAVEKSFKDYRRRVVDSFGAETDRLLKNGIINKQVTITDDNGNTKKLKETLDIMDPNEISQYARFFDEGSKHWSKSPEYSLTYIRVQQSFFNDLLKSRGHVFLNEVYDALDIPRTQAGAIVGWVLGAGDDYIDFGMYDGARMTQRDFVNGIERTILLDFNVDGVIYDLI